VLARLPGGRFPDGLAYAPGSHRVFVSDEYRRQEVVIDGSLLKSHPSIPTGGEVGNTLYHSVSSQVWIAIQTRNELAAIDPVTDSIVMRVAVPGIERPHGFAVDAPHRLAYVAGEGNARLGPDLTAARATCAHCGTTRAVGALVVYAHGMGTVVRCPSCDAVVLCVARTPTQVWLELTGARHIIIAAASLPA
jgi:DNA-binding beta-propeller fold protein YncE